jgi:hypothetical protein
MPATQAGHDAGRSFSQTGTCAKHRHSLLNLTRLIPWRRLSFRDPAGLWCLSFGPRELFNLGTAKFHSILVEINAVGISG